MNDAYKGKAGTRPRIKCLLGGFLLLPQETIMNPDIHKVALMTHFILAKAYHCDITKPSLIKERRSQRDHKA
jgi:hypothetical protein